ncbi:MAG TPA: PQQ-binding-like beta-propeller repeat protein [Gammaproteobacteria bacterium]|nr:PQQ-binding-like beta-propeller repeat protein [Gammaproteobacteria bacterium]
MTEPDKAASMARWVGAAVISAAAAGWAGLGAAQTSAPSSALEGLTPVTDAMLQHPPAADWPSFRRTLDDWGYSPLDEIDAGNVSRLHEAWSLPLEGSSIEATPLVHDGVMFLPLPGDRIVALDAATGAVLWRYAPEGPARGGTKRNIAIYGNNLFSTSSGGALFAVDARTGKQAWQVQLTGRANTSSGPIIANGKVISGRACAPDSGPEGCVMIANDARTGKELWRTWTIAKPGDPNDATWGGVPWEKRQQVGTWMPPSYDPALNLVYFGTSVTGPTTKYLLAGNDKTYLYHTSTLALDADTGKIVWYYQHIVDQWDLDHTFERILVNTQVAPDPHQVPWINPKLEPGETRDVVTGIPGKTGIVYALDRKTGEFLWARPTIEQNVVASIDPATGKANMNPDTVFTGPDQSKEVCPADTGGKDWMPGAYSPQSGLMYMPLENVCSTVTSAGPKTGIGLLGMRINFTRHIAPGATDVGQVWAISASTGETAWVYSQRAGTMGLVATGGGLVFDGDVAGVFRALDARTGKVLWQTQLSGMISGIPIAYAAGGKQFVAVATGPSSNGSSLAALTKDVHAGLERVLHVFALE